MTSSLQLPGCHHHARRHLVVTALLENDHSFRNKTIERGKRTILKTHSSECNVLVTMHLSEGTLNCEWCDILPCLKIEKKNDSTGHHFAIGCQNQGCSCHHWANWRRVPFSCFKSSNLITRRQWKDVAKAVQSISQKALMVPSYPTNCPTPQLGLSWVTCQQFFQQLKNFFLHNQKLCQNLKAQTNAILWKWACRGKPRNWLKRHSQICLNFQGMLDRWEGQKKLNTCLESDISASWSFHHEGDNQRLCHCFGIASENLLKTNAKKCYGWCSRRGIRLGNTITNLAFLKTNDEEMVAATNKTCVTSFSTWLIFETPSSHAECHSIEQSLWLSARKCLNLFTKAHLLAFHHWEHFSFHHKSGKSVQLCANNFDTDWLQF